MMCSLRVGCLVALCLPSLQDQGEQTQQTQQIQQTQQTQHTQQTQQTQQSYPRELTYQYGDGSYFRGSVDSMGRPSQGALFTEKQQLR